MRDKLHERVFPIAGCARMPQSVLYFLSFEGLPHKESRGISTPLWPVCPSFPSGWQDYDPLTLLKIDH